MSAEVSKNVQVVMDYFQFCVDGKQTSRVGEFFAENTVIHRPDCDQPLQGLVDFEAKLKACVTERYEHVRAGAYFAFFFSNTYPR